MSEQYRSLRPRRSILQKKGRASEEEASGGDDTEMGKDDSDCEPRLVIKEETDDNIEDKGERIYECNSCNSTVEFANLADYLQHLKEEHHQKSKTHGCPHCNYTYQNSKKLQRHILTAHKDVQGEKSGEIVRRNRCTMCNFVAYTPTDMENHQRLHHLKRRFFRCTKCSYMTHVRARYTKHVKYHSMPMIKCDDCDFRTPYKWNLDRHTRNHGGGGAFQCRACNFTAEIRQSLTVHEANHHEPPIEQMASKMSSPFERKPRNCPKRYNQVGASDYREVPTIEKSPVIENSVDVEDHKNSSNSDGADCIALKCEEKGCQFITAWDSEMQRHLAESHAGQSPGKRKPLPMLIPLSPGSNPPSVSASTSPPTTVLNVPRVRVRPELAKIARDTEIAKLYSNPEVNGDKEASPQKNFEKRNASFFDKLKERLLTSSGITQATMNNQVAAVEGGVPQSTTARRVFKCPHCPFWASTASRFHVHIVGHLNRKPFECSLCAYRSNWRWDITKHIKLKAARDAAHVNARVLMTDETGRRNYSKYNKYLTQLHQGSDAPASEETQGCLRSGEPARKVFITTDPFSGALKRRSKVMSSLSVDVSSGTIVKPFQLPRLHGQSLLKVNPAAPSPPRADQQSSPKSSEETKRTLWKCKRCNYRDSSKEVLLLHVKSHYEKLERAAEKSNKLKCTDCPFVANDQESLALHKVHHRPNLEAIFKCYLCPYYVSTKAELLEHARLHGEELSVVHQSDSKSQSQQTLRHASGDQETPPLLLDTRALPDTPMVWVSKPDGIFAKMFKCRHCPHVSSRRAEVRDHEIMHLNADTSALGVPIACPDCSFTCTQRDVMESHAAMHLGSLGTVHCLVADNRSDSQQLDDLKSILGLAKAPTLGPDPDLRDSRLVYSCSKCPARFLCDKELKIHLRYHSTSLAYTCDWCTYAARQPAHLLAHQKAHSSEYQERTRCLSSIYGNSQRFPPPLTACVEVNSQTNDDRREFAWIVVEVSNPTGHTQEYTHDSKNQVFTCTKCPARYFKLDALEYHMTLHGSNNRFKCEECDYSSKTAQNLMKHQVVHRRQPEPLELPHEVLQGQSRLQASSHTQEDIVSTGNPNFVYPGYIRHGKFKEKKYKCHKCPSAFEKREQYRIHLSLHGSKQKYRCETCDYAVKYYANYVQHLRKHHANAEAQASRRQMEVEEEIIRDEEEYVVKSRRKSTGGNRDLGIIGEAISPVSNQDKQTMLLIQRKASSLLNEANENVLRCLECPFSATDQAIMDAHKRRHGIERLTPPCPHCNYVPRKDENLNEHIRLHFNRMYKPEGYLIVEMLTLRMEKQEEGDEKGKENEMLFCESFEGKFLPVTDIVSTSPVAKGRDFQEKIVIDANTGEATHGIKD
ncbi:zinc finger protein 91 isoform X2 [Fopius arisanus]|uniref:Zinc finger protein 91 isoform X2 n=2 Tax=Fopius arisanus TaxID=64838 RepID=A0A9R1TEU7_9HYME|nr:PREDICTED: zinc finger protein 91-like isoform X2 [Fopius arisanus]